MPLSREEVGFFLNTPIFHFLPQNLSPLDVGAMKFTISCLLTLQMLHTNLVKIGPVVLVKKMLTDDGRRWTSIHSNRSPEWRSWPKQSWISITKVYILCQDKLVMKYILYLHLASFKFFMPPKSKIGGHIVFVLSVDHFVILSETLTLLITFEQWMLEFWYFTWVFLVVRPFRGYHYFWPCDLDLGVWPTF